MTVRRINAVGVTELFMVDSGSFIAPAKAQAPPLIPRLHDQANIKQPSSKCIENARARRVL